MSLTSCIKKAGKALAAEHKAALFAKAREYRTQGLTGDDAGKRAVQEQIELVGTLISEQTQLANQPAIGGVVSATTEAAKPPTGIDQAAEQSATSPKNDLPQPTDGQKEAGNYPKGHHKIGGLDISIENPAGSERSGVDKAGKPWKNTLKHHYGYFKGTIGNDKDHVDVFVKPGTPDDFSGQVFVIDQFDGEKFDEHKVVMGAQTGLEARQIYQANYAKDWKGGKSVTAMPFDEFKAWVKDGAKNKPVAGQSAAKEPSLDDLNSGKAFVDNIKAKIAEWVSKATNNGTREINKKWERAAVKRFIDANLKTMLDGKQTGNRATAKIAIGKSETFAQLVAAIEKFATPTANLSASAQPAPKTPEVGQDQPASTPNLLGRDSQPISEGGKPFKTLKEAKKEKKRQPLMRVISSPDGKGFVLAEKTEKQLAAEKKAARRISGANTGDGGPETAHAFIMSKSGLSKSEMADLGFDRNPQFGNRTLFARNGGLTMAEAMELLHEAGFISEETESAARSVIQKSANGQPQYTPEGWEMVAQAEASTRFGDHLAAQQEEAQNDDFDPFESLADDGFELDDIEGTGYTELADPIKLEVNALIALAESQGIDVDTIREEAHENTRNGSDQDYFEATRDALKAAIETSNRGSQQDSGETGDAQSEGLTAPTRQEVEAQQDRAENTQALDDKAQIDREAEGQTLTRPTAPEQRKDTSGDMFALEKATATIDARNRSGKAPEAGGLFDEPEKSPEQLRAQADLQNALADLGDMIALGGKQYPVEIYTTNAGKELRGAWVPTKAMALSYGPSTFEKRGKGFFVRERHFPSSPVVANEPQPEYSALYETDLFGNALPATARANRPARPAGTGVRGDAQPQSSLRDTEAPQGAYYVNTLIGTETNRELGAEIITTPAQAAQATQYLYKSAVERFDGIVTDKSGKPLAVVGGFKGAASQTSVYPGAVMAEAIRVPGGAHIWFSHNHPSGKSTLSRADETLNRTMEDVFRGSGIEPMGLLAVSNGEFSFISSNGVTPDGGDIPASTVRKSVPVIERQLGDGQPLPGITSPADASAMGKLLYEKAKEPGLMLLDAQHQLAAWVPIAPEMMGRLRGTGGATAIYRAVSQSNASSAIIVHGGELDARIDGLPGLTISQNVAAALKKVNVRPLDSINVKTGQSVAAMGDDVAMGNVFSIGTPVQNPITKQAIQKIVADIKKRNQNLPPIYVEPTVADIFKDKVPAGTYAKGASDGKNIYIFSDSHATLLEAEETIFHELFHHGLAKSLSQKDYNQGMVKFLQDKQVSEYAKAWRESKEGQVRKLDMPVNNWYALSAEEALARISEAINTGAKTGTKNPFWLRKIAQWAADLADMLGLKTLATAMRKTTMSETQRFVLDMVKAAGEAGESKLRTKRYSGANGQTGPFYSALTREVGNIPAKAQSGMGWAMNIAGLVKAGKVKQDEVEWSGITDWLRLQEGKVGREQVLAYLEQNGVQVTETVLGENLATRDELREWANISIDDYEDMSLADKTNLHNKFEAATGKQLHSGKTVTKYSQYQLPGGTNYREVLLTLPQKLRTNKLVGSDASAAEKSIREEDGTFYSSLAPSYAFFSWQEAMNHLVDRTETIGDPTYKSSHWDQSGVLAHIRVNDRVDADGARVLFVEEIQSDWGQQGKKDGFAGGITADTPMKAIFANGYWEVRTAAGEFITNVTPSDYRGDASFTDGTYRDITEAEAIEATRKKIRNGGRGTAQATKVPTAPFVTNTDKWLALALKRVIKMAVDGGYDKVAFVNGEQSAERYDLSKQVQSISYLKNSDGTFHATAMPIDSGQVVELGTRVTPEKLEETVGKEIAKKMVNGEGKNSGGDLTTLSGVDLKVGGEGMKAFYDKIIPSATKDVLRKLGGGQMETVKIGEPEWGVFNVDGAPLETGFSTRAKAEQVAKDYAGSIVRNEGGDTQPGFTLTDSMKTRAANGLPMFAKTQSGASQQSKATVEAIINTLKAKWKNAPEIVVVSDMQDPAIPERVRVEDLKQRSGGAKGTPEGFYYGGIVYLVSSQMKNAADVQRVLFHETLGHAGLRGTFGDGLIPILKQIAMFRKAEVDAKIKAYGLKKDSELDRLIAAEEVLAEMAQTRPELGFVKRAIAAIRTWLRENGFTSLSMTDNEIINNLILPARAFVEGSAKDGQTGEVRLSRSTPQTDTKAFNVQAAFEKHGGMGDIDESTDITAKSQALADMAEAEGWRVAGRGDKYVVLTKLFGDDEAILHVRVSDHSNVNRGVHFGETDINLALDDGYARDSFGDALRKLRSVLVDADGNTVIGDPTNPDIRFSLSDSLNNAANSAKDLNIGAGYLVGDLMNAAPGKLNWWHKTVGTQYNLAQRYPAFKRVFDGVQNFIEDISYYATESANLAPNILPKLEHFKDIWKSPMKAEDAKAIKAPIFEGTLTWGRDENGKPVKMSVLEAKSETMGVEEKARHLLKANLVNPGVLRMWQGLEIDQYETIINGKFEREVLKPGVVWTDAELKSLFNLTPAQIGLYREFRNATNQSLQNLAISDMLRFGGDDVAVMREKALAAKTVDEAANLLAEHLRELAELIPERGAVLTDTADKMIAKGDRATDLMKRGYAPLSRFGQYTLDVVENGERVYFGMFESKWEAAKMRREMEQTFPEAAIQQGTVSEESYKMFAGVSPETLELFGDMLGLESSGDAAKDQAFQTYLKAAKSTRSAMKRLIERKGIAGFNEDAGRVLAGFVTSNARQTSSNLHMGEVTQAAADKDAFRNQGELQDQAVKLVEYIKNPQEEAQAIRGLLFAQYIGGSIASAMVNMTQPITMTFPWLSQYGGAAKAAKQMTAAMKDSTKAVTGDKALDAALKRAEEDGTVSPQEVHQLQAQSMGRGVLKTGDGTTAGDAMAKASNTVSRVSLAWGKLFGAAEQFNRKVTFIAAYRTAVEQGIRDPDAFARKAVVETQGIYCVDDQTECLTASGWKFHSQLQPGEKLYAVNETGMLIESELMDVHRFTGNIAATEFRNSNGFSMVLTDDHTCLVQNYNSRDKKFQRIMRVKAKDVKIGHHFLRTPTGSEVKRTAVYTDDEVALFAWVAAEGHLFAHRGVKEKRGVGLVQSQRHNPQYVVEIDALLDRLGGHYNRKTSRAGEMVCWQLRKPLWLKIHEALPGKLISFDLVEKLTVRQMALFLEVFVKGDGHIPKFGGPIIAQKDIGNLDALQAMTVLSGKSSTIYPRMGESDCGALSIAKNSKRAYRKEMTATRVALEMAWCPETTHGTWIARRNGRTFITGNSKGNKPEWARGAIGGTLFTFKQFSVAYVEMLDRMARNGPEGKKAAVLALAVLFMLAGAGGMPGADDLDDLISGAMQKMGYNFNSKTKRKEFFASVVGEGGADFLESGFSGIAGFPIALNARFGMGNLIPGTGLLQKKKDHTRDVAEIFGPAGDLGKRAFEAGGKALSGEFLGTTGAVNTISPKAIQNLTQAADMATTGIYKDQGGRKVIDTNGFDAAFKAIGFQPSTVKRVQEGAFEATRMIELNRIRESEIADKWAKGIFEKDPAKVREARDELAEWNEMNPDSPIRIKFTQILQRTRKMNQTKAERIAATAPKEIRAQVRRELTQ